MKKSKVSVEFGAENPTCTENNINLAHITENNSSDYPVSSSGFRQIPLISAITMINVSTWEQLMIFLLTQREGGRLQTQLTLISPGINCAADAPAPVKRARPPAEGKLDDEEEAALFLCFEKS